MLKGEFYLGETHMRTTIKRIAELANVSVTTVSKILNGKDHDLNQKTIQRVKEIIKQENYKPSLLAQSMRYRQMKLIALLVEDIRNPFFSEVIRGCEDCAHKYGYSLVLCNTDNELEKEIDYIQSLQARHIDGLLLSGVQIENRILENQVSINVPFSFIKSQNYVRSQQYADLIGAELSTNYLIEHGHKNFLCIAGPKVYAHTKRYIEGFKNALTKHKLSFNEEQLFYLSSFTALAAYEEAYTLIEETKASAILCANDLIAYGILKILRELNIKVPQDISVIGYDDIDSNKYLETTLTSFHPNRYAMGWDSTVNLIEKIESKNLNDFTHEINAHLVIRETTGDKK